MPLAVLKLKTEPSYRYDSFTKGLKAVGYDVKHVGRPKSKEDLLVVWNLTGVNESMARVWERDGGTVLVCENGYVGENYYAISTHGHNGAGMFPATNEDRWGELDIKLKPWRETGDHILVCGQRGIGSKQMASPDNWAEDTATDLTTITDRPVRIRPHPGKKKSDTTLLQDLAGAWLCVIWSSSAGVKALIEGYPVAYYAPFWICSDAAMHRLDLMKIEQPLTSDEARVNALRRMAHAQWSIPEIESGKPFVLFKGFMR